MSFENCIIKAKQYLEESGLKMSQGRLQQMARLLDQGGADALTPAQFAGKMADTVRIFGELENAKRQAQLARDLMVNEKLIKNTVENHAAWSEGKDASKTGPLAVEALRATIEGGSLRPGASTNMSVEKMTANLRNSYLTILNRALGADRDAFASGVLDREIMQEKSALDNKLPLGQSGNDQALRIAKAMKAVQNATLTDKQAINPFMEAAQDFITERNHSRERVMSDPSPEGKQAWIDQAMRTFGEKSFPGNTPAEKIEAFKNIYDRIAAGTFGSLEDKNNDANFFGVKGAGGDLLRRMAKGRTLVAKDWQSEYEYASKYGDNLYNSTLGAASHSAIDVAKTSKWGSRPQDAFERFFTQTLKQLPDADAEYVKAHKDQLVDSFKVSMGSQNAPANTALARFMQGSATLQTAAKNGLHLLRSLPDVQNAITLTHDMFGKTLVGNTFDIVSEIGKSFAPFSDVKERMGDLGLFARSTHAEMMRDLGSSQSAPGVLSKTAELAGRLAMADRQQNSLKFGLATVLSKNFGELKDTAFESLPEQTSKGLARYGIGAPEWEAIRQSTEAIPHPNGSRPMITPDAIRALPDAAAEKYLRDSGQFEGELTPSSRQLDAARLQLSQSYGTLINEHADLAAGNTDVRQRAFMYGDTTQNSAMGLMRRTMFQFKAASLVSNDVLRRSYFSSGTPKAAFAATAQHIVGSAFFFMVGEYAAQLAAGKTPEDPRNFDMLVKAAVGSGGGGVYADALLGSLEGSTVKDKMVQLAETAAGPSLSALGEAGLTAAQFATAKNAQGAKDAKRSAAHVISANLPFQNLFYTKAAYAYYITNQLKEFMGPGYLGALERHTAQTPGLLGASQEYNFGRPTAAHFLGD